MSRLLVPLAGLLAALSAPAAPSSHNALLVGRYDFGAAVLLVTQEGDHLYEQLGPQERAELLPRSENEFFLKGVDVSFKFERDAKGRVTQAVLHQNGQTARGQRLPDITPLPLMQSEIRPLLGDYEIGAGRTLTILQADGKLCAQLTGQPPLELIPVSPTECVARLVNVSVTFVKDDIGRATSLQLHQVGRTVDCRRLADDSAP